MLTAARLVLLGAPRETDMLPDEPVTTSRPLDLHQLNLAPIVKPSRAVEHERTESTAAAS
jgi:hypothetical protein